MQTFSSQGSHHLPEQTVHTDVLMAGGELAGICAALAAARFSDASGDGVSGFLARVAHRIGAETPEKFGEKMAPGVQFGHKPGHTICSAPRAAIACCLITWQTAAAICLSLLRSSPLWRWRFPASVCPASCGCLTA